MSMVGKKIVATKDGTPFEGIAFAKGDRAALTHIDSDGDWWADFANQGNAFVDTHNTNKNAIWCVGKGAGFKLVKEKV